MNPGIAISVIIPYFNCFDFLIEALNSIHSQTLAPLETIIIDDGSTPALSLPPAFPKDRFKVVRQPNQGQAAARNHGARLAAGDWLAFLDADDVWHRDKLRLQMLAATQYSDGAAFGCRAVLIDRNGRFIGTGPGAFNGGIEPFPREAFVEQAPLAALVPSMALVKKSAFVAAGGFEKEFQPIEDLAFFDAFLKKGNRAYLLDQALLKRRMHGDNLTYKYAGMLRSYLHWITTRIEPDFPESFTRTVRGVSYQVTGLSALLVGADGASRRLLKRSWQESPRKKTLLGFAIACLGSRFAGILRQVQRSRKSLQAQKAWKEV